jgi:hypothetical protein
MGHGRPVESPEQFDARWENFFKDGELDAFDLRRVRCCS